MRQTGHAMRLDVLALDGEVFCQSEFSFYWPTTNDAYKPWSFTFPVRIKALIEDTVDKDVRAAANAVFSDISRDASRIACAASDIHAAEINGAKVILNKRISPVAAWIGGDVSLPEKISDILLDSAPNKPGMRDWKTSLRSLKRTATTLMVPADRRIDIQSINNIVSWILSKDSKRTPVLLYPDLLPFTYSDKITSRVRELTDVLVDEFREQLRSLNGLPAQLVKRCTLIFGLFLNERVNQAYGDWSAYKEWRRTERISGALVGGAPKVSGRLLGGLYRLEGCHVARCTHGGDRGFFDDPLWAFSELQEADEYWVHGPKEAWNIERRLTDKRILRPEYIPQIRAAGSPKHVASFLRGQESNWVGRDGKRVVLVAGLFSGEWNHTTIAFKPPDSLIADLQVSLLRSLKEAGHHVIVRPHPKGLLPRLGMVESFYRPHCDEILTGLFDPNTVEADVLVFDFPGSAWFDALSSQRGILLIDTGDRPFDPEGVRDLNERCAIVTVERAPQGGYRLDIKDIKLGLEEAMSKAACSEEFANRYFGLSLV